MLAPISAAHAQETPARPLDHAFTLIDSVLGALPQGPGLVIGITDRDRTLRVFTHGYADIKTKTAATATTSFAIGSISKSFTANALMQLADEGRFDPNAPVKTYVPWFALRSSFDPITGHHVLTHSAGMPNYRPDLSSMEYAAYALRDFEPSYAPGSHFWSSNLGFQTLGYCRVTPCWSKHRGSSIAARTAAWSRRFKTCSPTRGAAQPRCDATWTPAVRTLVHEIDDAATRTVRDRRCRQRGTGERTLPRCRGAMDQRRGACGRAGTATPADADARRPMGACDSLVVSDSGLRLLRNAGNEPMMQLGPATFCSRSADIAACPFTFEERGDTVIGVTHGPDVYAAAARPRPAVVGVPAGYLPLIGRYENHNPESVPVRIFVRDGVLFAALGGAETSTLLPVTATRFRFGASAYNPERLQFDTIVDGHAWRLLYSGMPMYRVDDRSNQT